MWRYLAGALAMALAMGAAFLVFSARAHNDRLLPAAPATLAGADPAQSAAAPLPATVPEATDRTREEKRFDRYDKDRNGQVSRDEYLAARRKAFAKLDTNGDGRLSFDEWAVKAEAKFAAADADKSGTMTRAEFATTAVKRKPARHVACPPAGAAQPSSTDEDS